eukprot:4653867-Alexandrium_andersonii.AAC.1
MAVVWRCLGWFRSGRGSHRELPRAAGDRLAVARAPSMFFSQAQAPRSLRFAAPTGAGVQIHAEYEVQKAAATFHKWLSKEVCILRSVLALLGCGGCFYSAQVQER